MTVNVPFADIGGIVSFGSEDFRQTFAFWSELDVVEKDAMGQWILSSHQTCPVRGTDRTSRDGVRAIDALF
jgi:hypothetical protein